MSTDFIQTTTAAGAIGRWTARVSTPPDRRRILLADDQETIRESLGRLLVREGFVVDTARSGFEAVERVLDRQLDLVLLDLSMPGLDGWQALRRIRELKPTLPVVIITAHAHQRAWVEPAGACAVLEKPLDIPTLLTLIRALCVESPLSGSATPDVAATRFLEVPPLPPTPGLAAELHSSLSE